jgi:hypothetical protein
MVVFSDIFTLLLLSLRIIRMAPKKKRKLGDEVCLLCQDFVKNVGHTTEKCPNVVCKVCSQKGHVSKVCHLVSKKSAIPTPTKVSEPDISVLPKQEEIIVEKPLQLLLNPLQGTSLKPAGCFKKCGQSANLRSETRNTRPPVSNPIIQTLERSF